MKLDWHSKKKPLIFLAPMSGVTDSPFRRIVKELNPEVLCVSEFISTDGLKYGNEKTKRYLEFHQEEQPLIVQIFGKNPKSFQKAAKMIEDSGASAIDLNMGCPARKVVSSFHGAALSKDPELAFSLVRATKEASKLPLSVKIRLGWDSKDQLEEFALGLQEAGAELLTVHGRTAKQAYGGKADWEPIYKLKNKLKIPVIGNGDLKSLQEGFEKIQNLDGFMIGRAAFGNPWIFSDKELSLEEKIPTILRHCQYSIEFYGEKWGMISMRKHLLAYAKGFTGARELRIKLQTVERLEEVEKLLKNIQE
ncbi:MAG: tRNA-dihydrouridine synthase [Candidatus Gracilibacteria bacterium]|nr:tRNA-dihydrouridine synthase [Candidatus Gracilibacteria bacterium]